MKKIKIHAYCLFQPNKRTLKKLILSFFCITALNCSSQNETLFNVGNSIIQPKVFEYNSTGYSIWWRCNSIQPGQLFTTFKNYSGLGVHDSMLLIRTWEDSSTYIVHREYNQYYKNILIEGLDFKEHINNGNVFLSTGLIIEGLDIDTQATVSESNALDSALAFVNAEIYAWEDDSLEYYLTADTTGITTYYPEGDLVITLTADSLTYDTQNFVLAWKFKILSLDTPAPYNRFIYVDAQTGQVLKELNMELYGTFNHYLYGNQSIDTKWHSGVPSGKYYLWADDNNHFIRTKDHGFKGNWYYYQLVSNSNDNWGNNEWASTAAHWSVTTAWDYFNDVYKRHGVDDHYKQIRIYAEDNSTGYDYNKTRNFDAIAIGRFRNGNFAAALDVCAHEYMHGITQHTAKLAGLGQPGALGESYSDIFGFMCERWFFPGSWDWTVGEDVSSLEKRNLANPASQSVPQALQNPKDLPPFYPEGYLQSNWYTGLQDGQGVHVNSSVQSLAFYFLSMGGTRLGFSVSAIGIDKAAAIAWYAVNNLVSAWNYYPSNKERWKEAAAILYGMCSFEYNQTCRAWAAVNVGLPCDCEQITINCGIDWRKEWNIPVIPELNTTQLVLGELNIYPNPTAGNVSINFNGLPTSIKNANVQVNNILGHTVYRNNIIFNGSYNQFVIDLSQFRSGVYIIRIEVANNVQRVFKIIKQ